MLNGRPDTSLRNEGLKVVVIIIPVRFPKVCLCSYIYPYTIHTENPNQKTSELSVYTNFHLLQFPLWKFLCIYINITIFQRLYLNEINHTVRTFLLAYLCYHYSARIVMLLSAVIFNVPNLLSYAGINLECRLGFAFISFFFYFASFTSHFLLIYLNQTKITFIYTGGKKKGISTGAISIFF